MKYLKKWYINLSIQRKILYCTLGVALVVLLAASVSQYMSASSIVTEQTRKQSAGVVNELSVNLDHYFDMVRNSFEYIANNSTVQEELESDEPYKSDGTELYSYYSRSGQIRRLLLQGYTSIYMNDIQLYGYNGANHLLANNHEINENTAQTSCELAEQAKGRCIYYNASEEGLMYMAKQIKDSLTMKPVGILRASIKLSYLKKMTITARDSLAAHIFLLDNDKNVLIESAENDATISDRSWIEKISGNTGDFLFTADGQGYDCVYQRSSDTGLTVVGMIPMSFLQKTARGLQKTTIMLILASLMLCIFLADILAKGIAGPIKRTSKAMQQFAEGDFSVRLPEGRRDEIGAMNSVFNQTIEKIEQLIKQVVEMETVNKDIEFQALQAQINPHFLYNVLDTINWMARKKGEDNICRMVTSISSLMRASISNKRSMVYIREEIKYVQDYLYIQETRYGDKFTSYMEVDEALNELEDGSSYDISSWDGSTTYSVSRDINEMKKGIRQVRRRAGVPDYTMVEYQDRDVFRKKLKRERQIELMAEGQRYFDLRRWKDAEVEESKKNYGCNFYMSDTEEQREQFYTPIEIADLPTAFSRKLYFWPISHDELKRNKRLTQNPGWTYND